MISKKEHALAIRHWFLNLPRERKINIAGEQGASCWEQQSVADQDAMLLSAISLSAFDTSVAGRIAAAYARTPETVYVTQPNTMVQSFIQGLEAKPSPKLPNDGKFERFVLEIFERWDPAIHGDFNITDNDSAYQAGLMVSNFASGMYSCVEH